MAKAQTFADKVSKMKAVKAHCDACGQIITWVKIVEPVAGPTGGYRFQRRMDKICKCVNPELLGK